MTGRRTALILLAAILAASPASARSLFDEDRADPRQPSPVQTAETPLADLVKTMALSASSSETLPEGEIEVRMAQGSPEWAASLEQFRIDPASGRFSAVAVGGDGSRVSVSGIARITVLAFVPARRIEPGEIVTESDLKEISVARSLVNENVLVSLEDIVGMEARRPLMQDRPVLARSLAAPRAVEKGKSVTIMLSEGGLTLTAPGKAMEDGGIGDLIRVINTHSTKIIHAEIVGNGQVRAVGAIRTENIRGVNE